MTQPKSKRRYRKWLKKHQYEYGPPRYRQSGKTVTAFKQVMRDLYKLPVQTDTDERSPK